MDNSKIYKNEIYWIEKDKNFVKLCFAFSPELHESLEPLDFIYDKILEIINGNNYKIFSVSVNDNHKISIVPKQSFEIDEIITILIPSQQEIKDDYIKQLFYEKKCNFDKMYNSFYSIELNDLQKCLSGSIIISHSMAIHCNKFSACPIKNVNLYNVSAYCVDIYGDDVQNLNWNL